MNPYQEFLSCQQDFSYFTENYLKIVHPMRGIIPFEMYPYQKNFIDTLEKKKHVLAIKFRQGGFLTTAVMHGFWKCMFQNDKVYYVASNTEREAIHVGKILEQSLLRFPSWFVPRFERNTQTEKVFSVTGSKMIFGTVEGAYNKHITHLLLDEAAFIPDMNEKWRLLWPTISESSVYVISATNGFGNWFYQVYHDAKERGNKFFVHDTSFRDHPAYADQSWIDEQRKQLGEKGYLQEVLGSFVADDDYRADLSNVKDPDLARSAISLLHRKRLSEQEKSVIWEMIHRLSKPK